MSPSRFAVSTISLFDSSVIFVCPTAHPPRQNARRVTTTRGARAHRVLDVPRLRAVGGELVALELERGGLGPVRVVLLQQPVGAARARAFRSSGRRTGGHRAAGAAADRFAAPVLIARLRFRAFTSLIVRAESERVKKRRRVSL